MTATTVSRLATTIAMVLVLSACPAISPNRPLPPSLDHAAQLAQRGDHAAAAREFEALAAENNVVDAPPLSLRAARETPQACTRRTPPRIP